MQNDNKQTINSAWPEKKSTKKNNTLIQIHKYKDI